MRSTRDLVRRRLHRVRKRGQLIAHSQNTRAQYQLSEFGRRLAYPANRTGVSEHFSDPSVGKSIDVDLALLERYDDLITDLELTIVREAKRRDGDAFHRLRSVPGIGKVLALTILYEIHDISRFDRVQEFASYARLVKCTHQSAGKTRGTGGAKMGNVHLQWAFSEAARRAVLQGKHGSSPATKRPVTERNQTSRPGGGFRDRTATSEPFAVEHPLNRRRCGVGAGAR
jgi:transposase